MAPEKVDISQIRNKIKRGELHRQNKKLAGKAKLRRRIARKEAEKRGEVVERGHTITIENTREWLGDDEDQGIDPRTRPAKVTIDEATGDAHVDLGTLSNLFPPVASTSALPEDDDSDEYPVDAKVLITTSPGKPPAPIIAAFLKDLQALLGGTERADIYPRKSPKFELGKVGRWAKARGYGAIVVVGEDHSRPTSLTISLLPSGPTAHFRLSNVMLCKDIPNHAKATSHPPELVLNHFTTPLGLSLATLLSRMFLPPGKAELLTDQGYIGRQVVLAQNSRDFIFIRRYRYMFVLQNHQLGKTKKKVGLEKMVNYTEEQKQDQDEVVKTRFQEIGPKFTVKLRWIRRGALGETEGDRKAREAADAASGTPAEEGDVEHVDLDGDDMIQAENAAAEQEDQAAEASAAADINLSADPKEADLLAAAGIPQDGEAAAADGAAEVDSRPKKKRKKAYHPLYNPPPSPSPPPGFIQDSEPLPPPAPTTRSGKPKTGTSMLSQVGKTWHAGKGEGGVREKTKLNEWEWNARMQTSRRKFFL